ncbi:hypothetical protein Moror_10061 [Moniliophthora roreri MCA 2997]|uniref:Uncharacterized protein n=2 Tax=Moniliophthora roreri TaxID=221103 RepID=V2WVC2_MONRO|nr:hypothetical protein Moror_10061 [Moniliophthora roreri MCA 2997]KAI3620005.1 hypothetical protein WG66_009056 [Moniliophthora roreri]
MSQKLNLLKSLLKCQRGYSTATASPTPSFRVPKLPRSMTANLGVEAGIQRSPYFWSQDSSETLEQFMTRNDISSPALEEDSTRRSLWIKRGSLSDPAHDFRPAAASALPDLQKTWTELQKLGYENRKENPRPRGNRKVADGGYEKALELQSKSANALKDIGRKYGWTSGAWLIMPEKDSVESLKDLWQKLAKSLTTGSLAQTSAFMIHGLVAPPAFNKMKHQLRVFMTDVYDEKSVEQVAKALKEEGHLGGGTPAVRPDIYQELGAVKSRFGPRATLRSTLWIYKDNKLVRRF